MKILSINSLFFSYAFLHLFVGALLLAFLKKTKNKSLQFIVYSCFSHATLYFLLVSRPSIPDLIGLTLPNFLSVYTLYFFYKALNNDLLDNQDKSTFNFYIFVFAIGYATSIYLISQTPYQAFTPLIVGLYQGAGNLIIARALLRLKKKTQSFFIQNMYLISVMITMLWITRAILSFFFEIRLAVDQTLINSLFFLVILLLVFVRVICFIGLHLDNSIQYQFRLEKYNGTLLQLVEEVKKVEGFAKGIEDGMLNVLNQLSKERDNETGNHIIRTQHFVRLIANRLDELGKFEIKQSEDWLNILFKAAPLHDIGKVGIPDNILLKNGRLSPVEWEVMKSHALIGERILSSMDADGQISSQIIKTAIEIAGSHHENWDGTGYPRGLSGKDIPQSARIMALADVYDALLSTRPYKKPWSYKETVNYIISLKGTKFDPDVVDAFIDLKAEFRLIRKQFKED
ncbi:HD-GYP domain-containing protein [Polynucleobacter kasalickyi]|uniref:HD domain-containing protein n=1 Tax=Polynucleobacter kasalickyi TaxID=1938817 RepID=A0A1W1Y3Q8_9BURK|nr:HD domain-containing phosphohydrolase [Polynucleobacter kasalickyi]SMC30803.1 HD domain-containing protein [Polynucleobacter kasalickyi]